MRIKRIFVFLLLISFNFQAFAINAKSDEIIGFWLSEKGNGVVEIFKKGDEYQGKLVWIQEIFEGEIKDKLDEENPDEKLQKRSLQGLRILHGFKFKDGEWSDGKIYDPESGNTYSAYMKLKNKDKLKLRGYIGISLFGRTSQWVRQKSRIPDRYQENQTQSQSSGTN